MAKSTSTSLWRPGNALSALGILILKGSARLPLPWLQWIGKVLGTLMWWVFPYRKHVGMTNLRLCYPDKSEKERRDLLLQHYQAIAMGIFELGAAWYKSDDIFPGISEVVGLEHLDKVTQSGRGAVLLTAHFTALEMVGRILLQTHQISCLYRKPDQPILAREMIRMRTMKMKSLIHMEEMNDLIRALRRGELVWYTGDQGKKVKYSEVLPFFGVPAVSNTATGRIARMGKAAVLPFVGHRLKDGNYRVEIYPEIEDFPTRDTTADAIRINGIFEELINTAPDQYFWLHKRFKRRGPGYEDVYAK